MKIILMAVLALFFLFPAGAVFAGPPYCAPQGYFQAERLADILEEAARQTEEGLSVKDMLSKPYKVSNKVVVDFSPPSYPRGINFSLDNMLPDNSSNTISVNVAQNGRQPNGHLIMACFCIVLHASQPSADINEDGQFARINSAINAGQSITINGWTYAEHLDSNVFTFSATAVGK